MNGTAASRLRTAHTMIEPRSWSVLLVGPLPPPPGGMANQTHQLAVLLAGEGYRVNVVQVNVAYRPAWVARLRGVRALFRLLPYVLRLWRAAKAVDLIHVMANSGLAWYLFAAPAVWIGWIRNTPVIVNYRGGDADKFFSRQFRWVRPTLMRASAIIVPSEFLKTVFVKYGVATTLVPNIINLDAFRPATFRPRTPTIIITRNLEPIYDVGTAIRAFALVVRNHPDARLTIAGSGPSRVELEQLARELHVDDRVYFSGQLDNSVLPDVYRAASVFVNASLVDNMPISLLEAMASGVPIVSTKVGGVAYLVKDGETAFLVPPKDPEAMAEAIGRVLADTELASRIAKNALVQVEQYAWTQVREKLLRAYVEANGIVRRRRMS
jgi:glycosyltransferase involved in cell wall biosynthesis